MKQFLRSVSRHRKAIALCLVLIAVGACFRWEVAEIDDARTGQPIARHHRVVFPWRPCGADTGGKTLINFHVRHWLCYGLIRVEATGQTM